MIAEFSEWLQASALTQSLAATTWVVPLTQTIHILAIAVVFASSAMLDLRLLQIIDHPLSVEQTAKRFLPWVWRGLVVLLLTGIVMIIIEPKRELLNTLFWIKMFLVAAMVPLMLTLQSKLRTDVDYWSVNPARRNAARVLAVISLAAWVAIIFCGRWIAYAGGPDF